MPVNFTNEIDSKEKDKKQSSIESENASVSFLEKTNRWLLRFSKVPLKERVFFVQNLSLMLRSGISLSISLRTLSKQTPNKRLSFILEEISDDVEKGNSFSESLQKHKKVFGEMFVSMVDAGEISGKLEEVLSQLYIQMKKENALISKVKGALTYPAVIVIAMLGIGTFMLIFVVPKITAMFSEMDAELPLPTKILIKTSEMIVQNGLLSATLATVLIVGFFKAIKTKKGQYIFHGILLKLPVFSTIIKKINIARFARNISSLLKTDIMIIKSFQITSNVLGNVHYKNALLVMAQKIKKGEKLNEVISSYPHLFTPVVAQMVAIGEETGELDSILEELAGFYEEEIDLIMDNLPAIIEPLLILMLGLGVGGVAIAIIMPMYAITNSI